MPAWGLTTIMPATTLTDYLDVGDVILTATTLKDYLDVGDVSLGFDHLDSNHTNWLPAVDTLYKTRCLTG